jgi:hypothetical protein
MKTAASLVVRVAPLGLRPVMTIGKDTLGVKFGFAIMSFRRWRLKTCGNLFCPINELRQFLVFLGRTFIFAFSRILVMIETFYTSFSISSLDFNFVSNLGPQLASGGWYAFGHYTNDTPCPWPEER